MYLLGFPNAYGEAQTPFVHMYIQEREKERKRERGQAPDSRGSLKPDPSFLHGRDGEDAKEKKKEPIAPPFHLEGGKAVLRAGAAEKQQAL